jgi:hypothetical protein
MERVMTGARVLASEPQPTCTTVEDPWMRLAT